MPEKIPRYFVEAVREQKENDPHPYDAVFSMEKGGKRVGFVRDNFICEVVNEGGKESTIRIPTTITYFKAKGDERWHKKLYGYQEGVEVASDSDDMNYYVVFDPSSELSFLAMPLGDSTTIARCKNNLELFLQQGHQEDTEPLTRFMSEFKGINFGLFGSRPILDPSTTRTSDIDLVVYGPEDLQRIVSSIEKDDDLCKRVGLTHTQSSTIEKYVPYYMKKFNLTEDEARIITIRRRRYILNPSTKLSLNCALPIQESKRKVPSVIGSKKIHDITIEASAVDTALSSALPRIFSVESEGKNIDVVTSAWSLKDFIRPGDKVKITGALRESDGVTFISLERPDHIIKPIVDGK
jgi:predicted nucleotidyltransferase